MAVRAPEKKHFVPLAGRLNYAPPDRVHLEVSKFGRLEFSLGSDGQRYWFWSRRPLFDEEPNTLWTGTLEHIDRSTSRRLLLRPDIVADALGLGGLRPRRRNDILLPEGYRDRYVLDYLRIDPASGRLRLLKKIFLDRRDGRVMRIDYFAPGGTHIVRVLFEGECRRDGVRLPRKVTLQMPLSDWAVRLDLGRLRLREGLPPEAFAQPDFEGARRIDLDEEPTRTSG